MPGDACRMRAAHRRPKANVKTDDGGISGESPYPLHGQFGSAVKSQKGYCAMMREMSTKFPARASTQPTCDPEAIAVMREVGIDISGHRSKSVDEFAGQDFDYVITVCDNAKESCPSSRRKTTRIHWSIEDPAAVQGSEERNLDGLSARARR